MMFEGKRQEYTGTFDQVDIRKQKVKVGSGEEVFLAVSDSGGNLPFSPLFLPRCPRPTEYEVVKG